MSIFSKRTKTTQDEVDKWMAAAAKKKADYYSGQVAAMLANTKDPTGSPYIDPTALLGSTPKMTGGFGGLISTQPIQQSPSAYWTTGMVSSPPVGQTYGYIQARSDPDDVSMTWVEGACDAWAEENGVQIEDARKVGREYYQQNSHYTPSYILKNLPKVLKLALVKDSVPQATDCDDGWMSKLRRK